MHRQLTRTRFEPRSLTPFFIRVSRLHFTVQQELYPELLLLLTILHLPHTRRMMYPIPSLRCSSVTWVTSLLPPPQPPGQSLSVVGL